MCFSSNRAGCRLFRRSGGRRNAPPASFQKDLRAARGVSVAGSPATGTGATCEGTQRTCAHARRMSRTPDPGQVLFGGEPGLGKCSMPKEVQSARGHIGGRFLLGRFASSWRSFGYKVLEAISLRCCMFSGFARKVRLPEGTGCEGLPRAQTVPRALWCGLAGENWSLSPLGSPSLACSPWLFRCTGGADYPAGREHGQMVRDKGDARSAGRPGGA